MPPMADDDTPPPPERPIIRQAVAFSATLQAPPSISTYQASLPTVASKKNYFLPGQEVPANPGMVMDPKPSKTKKTGGAAKRAKRGDKFSGQTSRFRLQAYDPTPNFDPPLAHGQGPYSSLYRYTSEGPPQESQPPAARSTVASITASSSQRPRKEHASSSSTRAKSSTSRSKISASKGKALQTNVAPAPPIDIMTGHGMPPANLAAFSGPSSSSASPTSFGTNSYYRRDYEGGNTLEVQKGRTPRSPPTATEARRASVQTRSPSTNTREDQQERSTAGSISPTPISPPPAPYRADPASPPGKKPTRQPLRMVTLLMQDIRSGEIDHQLAEVKVPLRPAEDPRDGYWADAKELSEKLQAGPARIDGPAKAYTLRGKYRQFFLRVSADNIDEFISANIVVNPDRTLDVVIETLLPPGAPPLPPRIPMELVRAPSPLPADMEVLHRNPLSVKEQFRERNEQRARGPSTLERRPSPFDDYDGHPDNGRKSLQHASTYGISREVSMSPTVTSTGRSSVSAALPPGKRIERCYDSPVEDDDPETVHELVSKATDTLLQMDSGWALFFRAKAAPQNCQQVLKQYEFVQRMMDKWVGEIVPFKSVHHEIEESHILQALRIEDEEKKYASNCTETLDLLALYGKGGSRYENQRVVDLVNDQTRPAYNAKPIKRLLHLLREVDEQWRKDQASGASNSIHT